MTNENDTQQHQETPFSVADAFVPHLFNLEKVSHYGDEFIDDAAKHEYRAQELQKKFNDIIRRHLFEVSEQKADYSKTIEKLNNVKTGLEKLSKQYPHATRSLGVRLMAGEYIELEYDRAERAGNSLAPLYREIFNKNAFKLNSVMDMHYSAQQIEIETKQTIINDIISLKKTASLK